MTCHIISDSTANFRADLGDIYPNLHIVPLNIHIGNEVFKDGIDIKPSEIYQRMLTEDIFPQTSQPSAGDFLIPFKDVSPGDDALIIVISSKLSGTIQSAQMAAEMLSSKDINVVVFDSLSTTSGAGYMVEQACKLSSAGYSIDAIVKVLENIRDNSYIYFIPKNLEYLFRGGRIGKVSKYFGNALQIKPILALREGLIEPQEKVRTLARAHNQLFTMFEQNMEQIRFLSLIHAGNLEDAQRLAERIKLSYQLEIPIYELTPVIGSHVGPGTIGLIFNTADINA